jgi:hypothetical protein
VAKRGKASRQRDCELPLMRRILGTDPALSVVKVGELAALVEEEIYETFGESTKRLQDSLRAGVQKLKEQLRGANPSPLVTMLADLVGLTRLQWLHAVLLEDALNRQSFVPHFLSQANFHALMSHRACVRLQKMTKLLALAKKLAGDKSPA